MSSHPQTQRADTSADTSADTDQDALLDVDVNPDGGPGPGQAPGLGLGLNPDPEPDPRARLIPAKERMGCGVLVQRLGAWVRTTPLAWLRRVKALFKTRPRNTPHARLSSTTTIPNPWVCRTFVAMAQAQTDVAAIQELRHLASTAQQCRASLQQTSKELHPTHRRFLELCNIVVDPIPTLGPIPAAKQLQSVNRANNTGHDPVYPVA